MRYNSLHQFYCSKEWLGFKEVLKIERGMICEHCHKLIHESIDAIGHHIIELTMDNVNDPEVSLNKANVMLVHRKCHNVIHNRFGYAGTKHRYLVYGPPLAGKRKFIEECATKNDLVISMDDIRYGITGGSYYENSGNTLDLVFDVHDMLISRVKYDHTYVKSVQNIYIVGGYAIRGKRERICRELKLEPIFIDVSMEECLARLDACTDRDKRLHKQYIDKWFADYS